jgi:hypothetical protein
MPQPVEKAVTSEPLVSVFLRTKEYRPDTGHSERPQQAAGEVL